MNEIQYLTNLEELILEIVDVHGVDTDIQLIERVLLEEGWYTTTDIIVQTLLDNGICSFEDGSISFR